MQLTVSFAAFYFSIAAIEPEELVVSHMYWQAQNVHAYRRCSHAGYSMRNLTFDLHLDWETVPVVGVLHRSRRSFQDFAFPAQYFRTKDMPRSNSAW